MTTLEITCTRCNGTGRHSFNLRDGSMCYGCSGKGTITTTATEQARKEQKAAIEASKIEAMRESSRISAATRNAMYDRLLPQIWKEYAGSPRAKHLTPGNRNQDLAWLEVYERYAEVA
jgi:DNA-binding FadR family transcriptional regulator